MDNLLGPRYSTSPIILLPPLSLTLTLGYLFKLCSIVQMVSRDIWSYMKFLSPDAVIHNLPFLSIYTGCFSSTSLSGATFTPPSYSSVAIGN